MQLSCTGLAEWKASAAGQLQTLPALSCMQGLLGEACLWVLQVIGCCARRVCEPASFVQSSAERFKTGSGSNAKADQDVCERALKHA